MTGRSGAKVLGLLDLVEASRWQRVQDHFAGVLGIAIRTISPSRELLVNPSWPSGLDVERAVTALKIGDELDELFPSGQGLPQETSSYTNALGVTYASVPIHAAPDQVVGYFVVGPVVVGPREDELQFRQRISAMAMDAQVLWSLLLSLKLHTFASIRSVLNLIGEVGSSLAQLAYQAKQLPELVPVGSVVDQAVVSYYTDRVLHSLLEAAMLATRAEGGSVMLFDAGSDALRIKAAHGLSEEVVAGTTIRRGEGIAGLAVTQRAVLVLDDQTPDARLRQRMGRSELAASLVAPLLLDSDKEAIGVLNLRTANPQRRFLPEHVELLRRLLDLAGAALISLRAAFTASRAPLPPQLS
jgi:GAF domain-containing protein